VGEPLPYWFASFQRSFANDTDNAIHRDSPTYRCTSCRVHFYSAVEAHTPGLLVCAVSVLLVVVAGRCREQVSNIVLSRVSSKCSQSPQPASSPLPSPSLGSATHGGLATLLRWSALLYLNPSSPLGLGTATWRHKASGLLGDPRAAQHAAAAAAAAAARADLGRSQHRTARDTHENGGSAGGGAGDDKGGGGDGGGRGEGGERAAGIDSGRGGEWKGAAAETLLAELEADGTEAAFDLVRSARSD